MDRDSDRDRGRDSGKAGELWLVGAGPGDFELLTLKAARLIGEAEVLVHDPRVDAGILALAAAAETIDAATVRAGDGQPPAAAIHALLVRLARSGRKGVRLLEGDPFIFGGGEELEAARRAGISCHVVPGISAALGCASEAGLPLTHDALSSTVSFVSGTADELSGQDWKGLAGPGRTLVVYMGVKAAGRIAEKLVADGVSGDMPVSILERGTLPGARAIRTLLAGLGEIVADERVRSPAVLVVGSVAGLAHAEDVIAKSAMRRMPGFGPW